MLKIEHLTKNYGNTPAVDDLTLHIRPGECCGFIGHNGAGKTTTLKCCCGLLGFDSGSVTVDGLSVKDRPLDCKRRLAYIPDEPDIYGFMSGAKFLNFVADVCAIPEAARADSIRRYAEMFEIEKALPKLVSEYSHGMKQKLAVVAALIRSPRLLVLDEPFVGLDPKASHTLKEQMRLLCDSGGAIFFSTHVLEVAKKLCDSIAIIRRGRLVRYGATDDVRGDESLEDVFLELTEDV